MAEQFRIRLDPDPQTAANNLYSSLTRWLVAVWYARMILLQKNENTDPGIRLLGHILSSRKHKKRDNNEKV
jgi:hypothetical protein